MPPRNSLLSFEDDLIEHDSRFSAVSSTSTPQAGSRVKRPLSTSDDRLNSKKRKQCYGTTVSRLPRLPFLVNDEEQDNEASMSFQKLSVLTDKRFRRGPLDHRALTTLPLGSHNQVKPSPSTNDITINVTRNVSKNETRCPSTSPPKQPDPSPLQTTDDINIIPNSAPSRLDSPVVGSIALPLDSTPKFYLPTHLLPLSYLPSELREAEFRQPSCGVPGFLSIHFGSWSDQGKRPLMEDTHFECSDLLSLGTDQHLSSLGSNLREQQLQLSFFGVFDGHRGWRCSSHLKGQLHQVILNQLAVATRYTGNTLRSQDFPGILSRSFMQADRDFQERYPMNQAGSTAAVCLLETFPHSNPPSTRKRLHDAELRPEQPQYKTRLHIAHVGDSRIVMGCYPKRFRRTAVLNPNDFSDEEWIGHNRRDNYESCIHGSVQMNRPDVPIVSPSSTGLFAASTVENDLHEVDNRESPLNPDIPPDILHSQIRQSSKLPTSTDLTFSKSLFSTESLLSLSPNHLSSSSCHPSTTPPAHYLQYLMAHYPAHYQQYYYRLHGHDPSTPVPILNPWHRFEQRKHSEKQLPTGSPSLRLEGQSPSVEPLDPIDLNVSGYSNTPGETGCDDMEVDEDDDETGMNKKKEQEASTEKDFEKIKGFSSERKSIDQVDTLPESINVDDQDVNTPIEEKKVVIPTYCHLYLSPLDLSLLEARPLTLDHKPNRYDEKVRVEQASGSIVFEGCWRIKVPSSPYMLAVSRAFGNWGLKLAQKGVLIADPEITTIDLEPFQDWFLIIATDGVWDVCSNEDAVRIVGEVLNKEERMAVEREQNIYDDDSLLIKDGHHPAQYSSSHSDIVESRLHENKQTLVPTSCSSSTGAASPYSGCSNQECPNPGRLKGRYLYQRTWTSSQVLRLGAKALIQECLNRKSEDNITVTIVRFCWHQDNLNHREMFCR